MNLEMILEEEASCPETGGGLHLMAEWHACQAAAGLFANGAQLRDACLAAVRGAGLRVVGECFHVLPDGGITGTLLLAESHLAVRTWPSLASVALDVFVCNHRSDNREKARSVLATLRQVFAPTRENLLQVARQGASEPD